MKSVLDPNRRAYDQEAPGLFLVATEDMSMNPEQHDTYAGAWQSAIRRGLKEQSIYIRLTSLKMETHTHTRDELKEN